MSQIQRLEYLLVQQVFTQQLLCAGRGVDSGLRRNGGLQVSKGNGAPGGQCGGEAQGAWGVGGTGEAPNEARMSGKVPRKIFMM